MKTLRKLIRKGRSLFFAGSALVMGATVASATPATPAAPDLSVITDYIPVLITGVLAAGAAVLTVTLGWGGFKMAVTSIWSFGKRIFNK
jgi:hypothetical protein